jgi:hypothetical protein
MKKYFVTESYSVAYPHPIILKTGDSVTIEKWETNPEWLGWAFCVDARGIKGWDLTSFYGLATFTTFFVLSFSRSLL